MNLGTLETAAADCLLVVDGQEANIQMLGSMLGKLGFEILPATTAGQAMEILAARRPDLILLDLILPDMDGFELCQRIQSHPGWADIPIIFLSAEDDKTLVVSALESGGVDYITRPFSKAELVSRVRTHLMLKTTRDHLKQLAQDKEELLGMMSHYLQNHLAGMQMSSQLLLDRAGSSDDPKLRLMAENIQSSSSQMLAFVKAFLANAATDRGLSIRLEFLDLNEAAARVVLQYQDAAKAKDITLTTAFPAKESFVQADAAALNQVLDNLISNAIKFSSPGKEVGVVVQRRAHFLECQVRDQGPGFTEEDKVRMFQRYARLSARPTGNEPSSGLGLSIVKKLTQAMGGELICESVSGKGAILSIRLPAATAVTSQ